MSGLDQILSLPHVPRETSERLTSYHALLVKWQKTINLVSGKTIEEAWTRHFLDSAQLLPLIRGAMGEQPLSLMDFGSGAGFPGLVLAALGVGPVTLVESDQRKSTFLRTVARELGLEVEVLTERLEALQPHRPQLITARALAPVAQLVQWAHPHLTDKTEMWLLKGQNVEAELKDAATCWEFIAETFPSLSDTSGCIVRLTEIRKKV